MGTTMKKGHKYTEKEIDEIVISQVGDSSKWGKPARVKPAPVVAILLKASLVKKAKAVALRKKIDDYNTWLIEIIQEGIKREERSFQTK
jgi:hypothetical protein